jgi:Lrp/AsnC family transcriptional regulator, regulator for asnA, asnC and gidA
MTEKSETIDELDKRILSVLMESNDPSYAEMGQQLFVSAGTIHVRIKKLIRLGIIKNKHIDVDYHKLGYDVTAFLGIFLEKSSMYNTVIKELYAFPEVVEAHYTTGNYSIFAKVICRDTKQLKEILTDHIQSIPGVQRTETLISLEESISRPLIPIESNQAGPETK